MGSPPLFRLAGISKSFGTVHANREISLDIHRGQILALLGENGAGKSTLMSILAGQLQPDQGFLYQDGQQVSLSTPQVAIARGIGMVYQHFKLIEGMSVAENVFLGQPDGFWLGPKQMNRQVQQLAERFGMVVQPQALVSELSMGEKQQVEILKLLQRESTLLIFDEPTAVLTPAESTRLFAIMRQMAEAGKALVFISHKLEEVLSAADAIAILKQGQIIDQISAEEVDSPVELARRMVGRPVLLEVEKETVAFRQVVLKIEELAGPDLQGVTLEIRKGEIFSLVGVAGNGQKTLVETICGLQHPLKGSIKILGQPWRSFFKRRKWEGTLSYIPEDRLGLATCPGLDLLDNFLLTTRQGFCLGPWLQRGQARRKAQRLLVDFTIRPPDLATMAWQLSGGNLQKLVLAREFYRRPRLIVAEQPTQGLDIAAAEEVWRLLLKAREQAGILLVTGDLSEALALADRVGVMFRGRLVGIVASDDREGLDLIPQMMAGVPLQR